MKNKLKKVDNKTLLYLHNSKKDFIILNKNYKVILASNNENKFLQYEKEKNISLCYYSNDFDNYYQVMNELQKRNLLNKSIEII